MYYVYMLLTERDTIYTGVALDVEKRFEHHKQGIKTGGAKYTSANKPVKILYKKAFETKSEAMKEEYRIKKLPRNKKLELICDNIVSDKKDFTMDEIEKYLKLYDLNLDELVEMAHKITQENFNNQVEFCSIISAKTGACSENCKYCSQSIHNHAEIEISPMLSVDEVKKAALSAKENGATRFAIVTSGRKLQGRDFETVLEMIKAVSSIEGLKCCACLGLLDEKQMMAIKEAGCDRYNHNINTSEDYYKEICTSHTFKDRVDTTKLVEKCGMTNCTGVIIGMGESRADRIKMALSLKEINPKSVPINILDPIKGTALENYGDKIDEEEALKTICIFRVILPNAYLRYAGGRRTRLSEKYQKMGLYAGINALIVGNYLTTLGNSINNDNKMLDELNLQKV